MSPLSLQVSRPNHASRFALTLGTLCAVGIAGSGTPLVAQESTPPVLPPVEVSGLMFGNYSYEGASGPAKGTNQFRLDRAYLTVRSKLSDRLQIRLTSDVFQTDDGDWAVQMKYAYAEYQYLKTPFTQANVRIGILPTLLFSYEEQFWPRWLSKTPVDLAGYFPSSDVGISTTINLPSRLGELYAGVTNGPGHAQSEQDRFKDYQARLALTPVSGARGPALLRSWAIVPYYYKGTVASTIPDEDAGLARDRFGVFTGIRDDRLTAGFDFGYRDDGLDSLDGTDRVVFERRGQLIAAYTTIKPVQLFSPDSKSPIGLVARYDRVTPDVDFDAHVNFVLAGITCDLGKRATIALNYQETTPKAGATTAASKRYALHWVTTF